MKYKVESSIPPTLFISSISGLKYIVPMWLEVPLETTLDDVEWNRPTPKNTEQKSIKVGEYVIQFNPIKKHYVCNCQGFFRVKDKSVGCKHIQAHKLGLQNS